MSLRPPTPHDFLLTLRGRAPHLARRLDGIRGLGRAGKTLRLTVPEQGWSHGELLRHREELKEWVGLFFGAGYGLEIEPCPPDPEALPFPVLASKLWNHVAFIHPVQDGAVRTLAVRKPDYLDGWLSRSPPLASDDLPELVAQTAECRVYAHHDPARGSPAPTAVLPELLDDLCALARERRSYVHLVMAFPGDPAADLLEGRLHTIKDWGTPHTPGPLLQRFVGRLHYVSPDAPPLGLRLAAE